MSWFSRVQTCVATSSREAEYVALGDAVKGAMFIRGILKFLEPKAQERTIVAHEDNEGAIHLATNPFSSSRSRHIDVRHHFVRHQVLENIVRVEYISSENQRADILTKALEAKYFHSHRKVLLNLSP